MAEKYEQDVFYVTKNLSLETKKQILIEAKELCYEWKVDILDASKSWTRQKTEMSFDKILDKLTSECHYSIVHRKGYKNWNDKKYFPHDWCIEFGFVEMKPGINHYLWIYVEEDKLDHFIERYKLEKK